MEICEHYGTGLNGGTYCWHGKVKKPCKCDGDKLSCEYPREVNPVWVKVEPESEKPVPYRTVILDKARATICGDREQDYGSPENSFSCIADMWTAYLKGKHQIEFAIEPKDVAAMMVALKTARVATGHGKEDNWIDICGYGANGGEIEAQKR